MKVKYEKDETTMEVDLPLEYFPEEEEKLEFLHKVQDLKSLVKQLSALKMFPQKLMKGVDLPDRVAVLVGVASVLRCGEEIKIEEPKSDVGGGPASYTSDQQSDSGSGADIPSGACE